MPPAPCPAAGASPTSPALRSHPARGSALSCSRPPLARLPSDRVPSPVSRLPRGLLWGRARAGPGGARCRPCAAPGGAEERAAVPPRGADARSRRCVHVRGCVRGATTRGGTCGGCERGGVRGRAASGRGKRRFPPPPTRLCPEGSSCALRGRWSAPRAERRVETEGR